MMAKVTFKVEENVATLTIDSPPVNALDDEVLAEIEEIVDQIEDHVQVVLVTGAGDKAFVAGADISEFPKLQKDDGEALSTYGQRVFQKIATLKQPVIAVIDGYALGGGLELALACDFRVATSRSQLGLPETSLGVIPGYGGTQRLPQLVGNGRAKQMIFSAEPISAEEAYRIGLIEILDDDAFAAAKQWSDKILKRGPLAVQAAKIAVDYDGFLKHGLETEAEQFGLLCETRDKNEGAAAFFEKRKPRFQGK